MNTSKYPLMTAIASASFGIALLSGCSTQDADAPTIAEPTVQTADADAYENDDYDFAAGRNNGSWGAVYMPPEELAGPQIDIVSYAGIPPMAEDPEVQKWNQVFGQSNAYHSTNGKELYHRSCAGCHMHDGLGAQGAGYYPPLANNSKMESKFYTLGILINGLRGMPSFHLMMNDEQMAAVTQYIMTDLNGLDATVTAEDVAQIRHDNAPGYDPYE